MKHFLPILFSFFLLVSFIGCTAVPNAESSSAIEEPSIAASEVPTPLPDPTPTPNPTPTSLNFTFDRYRLPADLIEYLAETGLAAEWTRLVDAIFAEQTSLSQLDRGAAENLSAVFAASPYSALADLTYENGELILTYTDIGTAAILESAVTDAVENVLFEESNTLETMLALYRTVSRDFLFEESENTSLYRMLVEKKGGTHEFAAAMQYLFAQANIPAYLAESDTGDFTHTWVIAEYKDSLYHFDPVFENGVTGGCGLTYFGMSDAAHEHTGCGPKYTTGFDTLSAENSKLCPETTFDDLFTSVTDWQTDILSHDISLFYNFETAVAALTLNTDTLTSNK